jgi:hypothetical protein
VSALVALALAAASACSPPEEGTPAPPVATIGSSSVVPTATCSDREPQRRAYFGDTHIHTALSMDAWTAGPTRNRPDDAYAFAVGRPLALPPYDERGLGTRQVTIDRPLDFAMVADHAEFFAAVSVCTDPVSPAYDTRVCRIFRLAEMAPVSEELQPFVRVMTIGRGFQPICQMLGAACRKAADSPWRETQAAAARWNDPCSFTTFVGYEYTYGNPSQLHRNVIFRNEIVTEAPLDAFDFPEPHDLWRGLAEQCNDAETGCEALAIPHSSNVGNGRMFVASYPGATSAEQEAEYARMRSNYEPLVEMFQYKGDSECRNGLAGVVGAPDELCAFEKVNPVGTPECPEENDGALACVSRHSFVRSALVDGLREADRIGANPFEFGLIGSTDFHNGAVGRVTEYDFEGGGGITDASAKLRLSALDEAPDFPRPRWTAGGLAGVFAEENTRDALFDGMRRRETFATSGPRIVPRFFAGWDHPEDLCEQPDLVARGYAGGTAMGGELGRAPGGKVPAFVVAARRDPGTAAHPGLGLERIQIVKGWVDDAGALNEHVFDVAGGPAGASVDTATCETRGPGHDSLCSVWRDPEFDPARRAVYYARVVENPSCRWSTWQCNSLPEAERPPTCETLPKTIQERAWTSPIWYTPAEGSPPRDGD